jgi:thioredoxin-related protein
MGAALRTICLMVLLCAPLATSRAGLDADSASTQSGLELIVVEAEGCIYCQLFRRDLLPAYETSKQAQTLPVRFVDINDIDANDLKFAFGVDIVPTFVVVKSRREVGRIAGYVAPETFFHSIDDLMASAPGR